MRRLHTLADGRAVATPILRWGRALEGWGGKSALIDGQECPSYFTLADAEGGTRLTWRIGFPSEKICERFKPICIPANEENFDRLAASLD